MRGVALLLGCLVASCAPDYDHSAFRCDPDHGCPSGQSCIGGRCRRGVPGDASVACGGATCDVAMQQCCADGNNAPRCIRAGDECPGPGALCDGPGDCLGDESCCGDSQTVACFTSCKRYVCVTGADCPSKAPNCCPGEDVPWGECSNDGC